LFVHVVDAFSFFFIFVVVVVGGGGDDDDDKDDDENVINGSDRRGVGTGLCRCRLVGGCGGVDDDDGGSGNSA